MARLCENKRSLVEVVHNEGKETGQLLVGSIEVECVPGETPNQIIDRVQVVPAAEEDDTLVDMITSLHSLDDPIYLEDDEFLEMEQGIETPDSFLEQLAGAFVDGCHCGPCAPVYKSVLRDPSRAREVSACGDAARVSFSCLEIHEFPMTLGDHPSAISGPPVALDWNSEARESIVDLDEYEQKRNPRRKRKQLRLSYRDRKRLLEQQKGFTTEQVNSAWKEALLIRQQRQETLKRGSLMMMWDDFSESSQRKFSRVAEAIGIH